MNKKYEKFLILITDFLSINTAFYLFFLIRTETNWFDLAVAPEFFLPMLFIYFYWLIIFIFVGLYRTWFASSRFDEISLLVKSSFFGIFLLFFLIIWDDSSENIETDRISRILIFYYWGLLIFSTSLARIIVRGFQKRMLIKGFGRRNALIIGFNDKAREVYYTLKKYLAIGLDPIGFISLKESDKGTLYKDISVIDSIQNIEKKIDEHNVKEVIIALEREDHDLLLEIITRCDQKNVSMKIMPDLYEILSGQARTTQLYGVPLIDIMPQLMPEWEKKLKRILDIIISVLVIILTFPLLIITSIAIKLDSKGPVLYKQERSGLEGKPFKIFKFRSMRQDAEKLSGPVWSQKNDPRITKTGKFIRRVRIDEIPQMINVLKGEMSLVGPRPERPIFVEKLSKEIPYYKRRLKVRPGITGWAQVKHKYDESIEDVKTKLKYDLFYIENISLRMDFKILFRTIFVVLFGKGHYE